ncbi:hypothetical protein GCM10010493_82180 [Streptomyces lavendulae subsp. grasserius]
MRSGDNGLASLAETLKMIAAVVEEQRGTPVEVVVVGDCVLDEKTEAQLQAACEAMLNASKYGGEGGLVQVYAEAERDTVFISVRDLGPGFELDQVPEDRRGVREAIIGRMQRNGGTVRLRTVPGGGTEVELEMPRTPLDGSADRSVGNSLTWALVVSRLARGSRREERETRQREQIAELWRVRRAAMRAEALFVAVLFALAAVGYVISVVATGAVMESVQQDRFSPSDTAQVITAVGGLATAVGLSIAGVLKALALLVHARADMVRARASLPPAEAPVAADEGEPTT